MEILIAGDTFPSNKNEKLFETGKSEYLFGKELLELFKCADFIVANLEGVFADGGCPIVKSGPAIKASVNSMNGFLPLGIDAFSLANNHILDYGIDALLQTVSNLENNGISCFGYGNNLKEARQPLVANVKGTKIGIYACAESEFTVASSNSGGGKSIR